MSETLQSGRTTLYVRPYDMSDALAERAIGFTSYKKNPSRCINEECNSKLAYDRRFKRHCCLCEQLYGEGELSAGDLSPSGRSRKRRGRERPVHATEDIERARAHNENGTSTIYLIGLRDYLDRLDFSYKDAQALVRGYCNKEGIENRLCASTIREWANLSSRCRDWRAELLAASLPQATYDELVWGSGE